MELAAEYVYKVYQEKSFSKAAEALYISQPALSTAILRLENKLGFDIFDRTTVPVSLTVQGQIYIQSLNEILESESNMRRKIRELSDMSYKTLTIGGGSSVSYHLLPRICSEFHKKYPDIKITFDIGNIGGSDNLTKKLRNHEIDLMLTYLSNMSGYFAKPIFEERLVIAMHKDLKGADRLKGMSLTYDEIVSGDYDKTREIEDLSMFHDIEFLVFPKSYDTAHRMTQILGDYKSAPVTIENAKHGTIHFNMMCEGLGAALVPDLLIQANPQYARDLLFFVPKHKQSYRTINFMGNKSANKNVIAENFITVAKQVCAKSPVFKTEDFC